VKLYQLLIETDDAHQFSDLPVKERTPMCVSAITFDGFCVTILSIIDLVDMLLDEYDFKYVLTGKFNQDCVEVG